MDTLSQDYQRSKEFWDMITARRQRAQTISQEEVEAELFGDRRPSTNDPLTDDEAAPEVPR